MRLWVDKCRFVVAVAGGAEETGIGSDPPFLVVLGDDCDLCAASTGAYTRVSDGVGTRRLPECPSGR